MTIEEERKAIVLADEKGKREAVVWLKSEGGCGVNEV
jgi:hypothetical protein